MERERDIFVIPVTDVMNRSAKLSREDELGSAVVYRMEQFGIMAMPVVDGDNGMVGMVHLHDLMRSGVV